MAEKKAQHIVPKTYLKEFSISTERNDKNGNKITDVSIYVNSKFSINKGKEKGLTNNIFTKSNFYNIKSVENGNPIIENNFSKIESKFNKILSNIKNKTFNLEDILFISNFTLIQHHRTPIFLKNIQSSFNRVADICFRMTNDISYESYFDDISLKTLINYKDENMFNSNLVFEQGINFIENTTDIPFITSDNPVVHRILYIDELKNILSNTNIVFSNNLQNEKLVFFFFPLTPKLALISSKFIMNRNWKFIKCDDINTICSLNYLSYDNSSDNIYSCKNETYEYFFKLKLKENILYDSMGLWALINTANHRYSIKLNDYKKDLVYSKLYIKKSENIENILEDRIIESIVFYQNKIEKGGMRQLVIENYNPLQNVLILKSRIFS